MTKKQNTQGKIRYIMYCRKSSDAEDRQVQSIPDQIRELKILAEQNGIEIVDILEESRSAKAPGRPVFTSMIERISRGEADGILVWKVNRLARNPVDGGTVSWMLQQGVVRHIQTYGRSYYPEDNVLMIAVELGMANQYVRDLSTDTKRGMRAREEKGLPNGVASIGFLNDLSAEPGNRGWLVDEERFPLISQVLELFSTGKFSARKITRIANEEMGIRTLLRKRQGGKKLVVSYMTDTVLKNPLYAGFFFTAEGKRCELHESLPRMITEEKYWHIQKILGNKSRARPSKNLASFAYVGTTRCGGCEGSVTAEHKYQVICDCKFKFAYQNKTNCSKCGIKISDMENPTYLHYVYYHCTRKKNPYCNEGSVQEVSINNFLSSYFRDNLMISSALNEWCIKNIGQLDVSDKKNEFEKKALLEMTLVKKDKEFKELTLMKARGQIDDGEYEELRRAVRPEIEQIKAELNKLAHVDPDRLKKAYKAFDLAVGVEEIFKNGTVQEKKEAFLEIGSNLTLKDRKLNIVNTDLYSIIMNGLLLAKRENPRFEPRNTLADKDKTEVFASVCPTLLRG